MDRYLPYLLLLICPISMGGMMLMMIWGNGRAPSHDAGLEKRVQELERDLKAASDREGNATVRTAP